MHFQGHMGPFFFPHEKTKKYCRRLDFVVFAYLLGVPLMSIKFAG
jgi:hypothetical protein